MDLRGIIHIQGTSGLHKIVSQTDRVIIAESMIDKKRMPITNAYAAIQVEAITIFSNENDEGIGIAEVFNGIYEKEKTMPIPDKKANDFILKEYFRDCVPHYDESKVYPSIIKKLLSWYTILKNNNVDFGISNEEKKHDHPSNEGPTL